MPTSPMAATAASSMSSSGAGPPDHATALSPARWVNQPRAICERPALWVQEQDGGTFSSDPPDQALVGVSLRAACRTHAWAPPWITSHGLPKGGVYDRSSSFRSSTRRPEKIAEAAMSMRFATSA